jgi:hypothetical protein
MVQNGGGSFYAKEGGGEGTCQFMQEKYTKLRILKTHAFDHG